MPTYYEKNKEHLKRRQREYYGNNKDAARARYLKNKDAILAKWSEQYKADPEKFKKRTAESLNRHPETKRRIRKAAKHRRRARLKLVGGSFSPKEWEGVVKSQGGLCAFHDDLRRQHDKCESKSGEKTILTVDHIIPISRGGTNDISNVRGLCFWCNTKKHTRLDSEI